MFSPSGPLSPAASHLGSNNFEPLLSNASSHHGANISVTPCVPSNGTPPPQSDRRGRSGNFFCPAGCAKSFKAHNNLCDHIMNVHQIFPPDRTVHRCNRCGKGFTKKSDLQKHLDRPRGCDTIEQNSSEATEKERHTSLSLEDRAKLWAHVKDLKPPRAPRAARAPRARAPRTKPKKTVPAPTTVESQPDEVGQARLIEDWLDPTKSLNGRALGESKHVQQWPGVERLLAANANVYRSQPLYQEQLSNMPAAETKNVLSPHQPVFSDGSQSLYKKPLMPVQSNINGAAQAYGINPAPRSDPFPYMILQQHPYQVYWNEFMSQRFRSLPSHVPLQQPYGPVPVNHQVFTTHQHLAQYHLFGPPRATHVVSQQLPAYQQVYQNVDIRHSFYPQPSLAMPVAFPERQLPTSRLYDNKLPGIRLLNQPFRSETGQGEGPDIARPESDDESSEITKVRQGQIMTALGNEKHSVGNEGELPRSQACVQMPPATPSGLRSHPEFDDHRRGTAGNEHDWVSLSSSTRGHQKRRETPEALPSLGSPFQTASPLPAPAIVLGSTSTPRAQRVARFLHSKQHSQAPSSPTVPGIPPGFLRQQKRDFPHSSYAPYYKTLRPFPDAEDGPPLCANEKTTASDEARSDIGTLGKDRDQPAHVVNIQSDTDSEKADTEIDSDASDESSGLSAAEEFALQKGYTWS